MLEWSQRWCKSYKLLKCRPFSKEERAIAIWPQSVELPMSEFEALKARLILITLKNKNKNKNKNRNRIQFQHEGLFLDPWQTMIKHLPLTTYNPSPCYFHFAAFLASSTKHAQACKIIISFRRRTMESSSSSRLASSVAQRIAKASSNSFSGRMRLVHVIKWNRYGNEDGTSNIKINIKIKIKIKDQISNIEHEF